MIVRSDSDERLARFFAHAIKYFHEQKIVEDYADCVLLVHSTRETKYWAGPYAKALKASNIPVYNPRARQFLEREDVKMALGALLTVLDRNEVPNDSEMDQGHM